MIAALMLNSPKPKRRLEKVTFSISQSDRKALKRWAEKSKRSVSATVNLMIEAGLRRATGKEEAP
jgi:hypothetical protein